MWDRLTQSCQLVINIFERYQYHRIELDRGIQNELGDCDLTFQDFEAQSVVNYCVCQ
jgi:hypothetical protein